MTKDSDGTVQVLTGAHEDGAAFGWSSLRQALVQENDHGGFGKSTWADLARDTHEAMDAPRRNPPYMLLAGA